MLRFLLVTAALSLIKNSKKMKYMNIMKRIGRNRAIVAIGRILVEIFCVMISKNVESNDEIETLSLRYYNFYLTCCKRIYHLQHENAWGGKYSMAFFGYFSMAENG